MSTGDTGNGCHSPGSGGRGGGETLNPPQPGLLRQHPCLPAPSSSSPGRFGGLGVSVSRSGTRRPFLRRPFFPPPPPQKNHTIPSAVSGVPRSRGYSPLRKEIPSPHPPVDFWGDQGGEGAPPALSLALGFANLKAAKATGKMLARWKMPPRSPTAAAARGVEATGDGRRHRHEARSPEGTGTPHPQAAPTPGISSSGASVSPGPSVIFREHPVQGQAAVAWPSAIPATGQSCLC